jgi:hypothetical protein
MRCAPLAIVLSLVALAPAVGRAEAAQTKATATATATAPSNQALVYFNARLALRDGQPADALRLWLLRNSLVDKGERGYADGDFQSIVWTALGDLGLCPDGIHHDDHGVGLWPLAVHNWILQDNAMGPPADSPSTFQAFDVAQQARRISLHDVLTAEELGTANFFRTSCLLSYESKLDSGQFPWSSLEDQLNTGRIMRDLLRRSLHTLQRPQVEGVAVVEARIFDLDLALTDLEAQRQREAGFSMMEVLEQLGANPPNSPEEKAETETEEGKILGDCLTWPAGEWLKLSRSRRLFLFARARKVTQDKNALVPLELSILDALAEHGDGQEIADWIGFLEVEKAPEQRRVVYQGARGARLLQLDETSGFHGRAALALHRGVAFLEEGKLTDSLRSFAFAMANSQDESENNASETAALARRWLSFVLSRYETTDEVIATLKALVPRQDYNSVIEDLAWRAALRADDVSFERVVRSARHGGSFDTLAERLQRLATGKPSLLATELRDAVADEPYFTLRFVKQLVERVEVEDADVRRANAPLLKLVVATLDDLAREKSRGSNARTVDELLARLNAILEGLSVLDNSVVGKARSMSVDHDAFAGNVRVAPSDPLPWPFRMPEPESPSAFVPLKLLPVEWRDGQGTLVFGWRVTE